jgi:hypothetical protein
MGETVARGGTTQNTDVYFHEYPGGPLYDPATPLVDVINPSSVVVVNNAVPTRLSLGHYYYPYTPAVDAPLGSWSLLWTGTIHDAPVSGTDTFTVVEPGEVSFDAVSALCSPWVTEAQIEECGCTGVPADYDWTITIAVVSEVLYLRSGQRWPGSCTETVRPCPSECDSCCCCWAPTITLFDDVTEIVEVWQDGELVPESEYRLDEHRYLVRLADADGNNDGWRACQRLDRPRTENETLEVTYRHGRNPPWSGVRAAAAFACQIALACVGSDDCTLPERVQTLTSQGVTMTMVDAFDFLDRGRLGVYEVDAFLSAVNPSGLQSAPSVISPDFKPSRRTG